MIGQTVTTDKGEPMDGNGKKLTESAYQPSPEVLKLFSRCMLDYQVAYSLQHRPFDYFDGYSLLQRTQMDQRTFGAFVGAEYVPEHKRWRWRGRKNTARNKLIAIAAHLISGMLFPTVFAQDDQQQPQKTMAQVMQIQVEYHLRKARYDINFLFMVVSALVSPAVFVQIEWIEAMQRVKVQMEDGSMSVQDAIDEIMSGLNLNIRPVDEIMLGDFYTFELQRQPYIVEISRISYDDARKRYEKRYYDKDGKDLFDYVQAGKTRVVVATQEKQVLYDIEWTEADNNFVQVLKFKYRGEDLEVEWVGGVFMGNEGTKPDDIYNMNPFKHRRITMVFDEKGNQQWGTMPIYNIAKSGMEPLDPYKRFAYYKSGAFKEFWEDDSINHAYRLLQDGMTLDVMKPIMVSGIAKVDGTVIAPGAVAALPENAKVTAYSIGPNLAGAMNVLNQNQSDLADSTISPIMEGQLGTRQSVMAVNAALTNAKILLGIASLFIADLVIQIGDLTVDCINTNCTIGMIDTTVPGMLGIKYKTYLAQSKEHGKDVTHRIVYTDRYLGKKMSAQQIRHREYELWNSAGGADSNSKQKVWEINPWVSLRMSYQTFVDADQIISRSIGGDKQTKQIAFDMLTDPRVAPFVNLETVANDFVIEEYGGNDPDRYKKKGGADPEAQNQMMQAIMGNTQGGAGGQAAPGGGPSPLTLIGPFNNGGNNGQVAPSLSGGMLPM